MKYFKRSNMYKASNVSFNPETNEAVSYNWWTFAKVINGVFYFNTYRYSVSTSRHQRKVIGLLVNLGINKAFFINTRLSLSDPNALQDALNNGKEDISKYTAQILNKRTRKHTKIRAYDYIKTLIDSYNQLKGYLGVKSEPIDPNLMLKLKRIVMPHEAFNEDFESLLKEVA